MLAAVAGVLAARAFAQDVADGLARTVSPLARPAAPVLLFFGVLALASLLGGLVLRATGVSRVVRGPTDRAAGALLGGSKGALAAWVVLSAFVLAREHLPARARDWGAGSDFAALARRHNLAARLDADTARRLDGLPGVDLPAPDRRALEEAERRRLAPLERVEEAGEGERGRRGR